MDYKRFDNTIVARFDRNEEILTCVKQLALAENIKLAQINAIGAVNEVTVGVYSVESKEYKQNDFTGDFEIVSLSGNINTMNGEFYSHLHMSFGDKNGCVFGGHLNRAVISATCEMFITVIDGKVDRFHDDRTGLNLFSF